MRPTGIALVLVLLCTGLSACGDDSDEADADSGVVSIGVEGPITGDQGQTGQGMVRGAQMAADEINVDGGIDGRDIEIVPIDDAADPATGAKAAADAVQSGLDAVIGPYNSGVGLKTLPIYEKAGLVPLRLTSDNATDGMGITLQPMTDQIAPAATRAITDWLKAKTVSIIYDRTTAYTSTTAKAVRSNLRNAGVAVSGFTSITPQQEDFAARVKQVAASAPDVMYLVTYFPQGGAIAKEMAKQQVSAQCFADYGSYDPGFVETAGVSAARTCPILGVPAAADFNDGPDWVSRFEEQFSGSAPGAWSPYTYDSVHLLAEVAERVGFERDQLKRALFGVKDWAGLTGKVSIDPKTGSRTPSTLAVMRTDQTGQLHIDKGWSAAVR